MIAGPALGGALIASAGLATTYLFDVATFVFSLFADPHDPRRPARRGIEAGPSLRSVLEGFRYARSRQELMGTYVVDFVAMVFGMPLALFPALAGDARGEPTPSASSTPRPPAARWSPA